MFFRSFQLIYLEVSGPAVSLVLEHCVPVVDLLRSYSGFRTLTHAMFDMVESDVQVTFFATNLILLIRGNL